MARSARTDNKYCAHFLDAAIVTGVIVIVLHIVLDTNGITAPAMGWVGLAVTVLAGGIGIYFKARRKDVP